MDVATHYAVLERAITDAGGVRPVEQGEGMTVISTFSRADDALSAAIVAHGPRLRRCRAPASGWGSHSAAEFRGSDRYVGGALSEIQRLRDLGHGGQMLASTSAVKALDPELPHEYELVEVGSASLRPSGAAETVCRSSCRGCVRRSRPFCAGALVLPAALRPEPATGVVGRDRGVSDIGPVLPTASLKVEDPK